jgi:tetratricopeptide (TPR) repeat protein
VAVNAEFDLTEDNAIALVQISQRLDGIPLAIELAAACVRFLPAQQIALRLNDRFNLLTDGSRTALPRHQTLHAVIDWSYNLLTEKEQILLCCMSVCVGGWTLEAAEAVYIGIISTLEVLELLARLVDKSLVEVSELPGGAARYRMLETVQQYGLERLSETGQLNEAHHRHALFFASLAEDAEKQLRGPEMRIWMRRLETEHDNFRVALDWSLIHEPPKMGLRFAGALGIFWHRGYLREGSAWLERLLTYGKNAPPYMRVKAMATLSWIARDLGDYTRATRLCGQALEILHRTQNKVETVPILIQSGLLTVYQNDPERALVFFEQCLALSDELDYRWGRAMSLVNLAHAALFNLQWDALARSRAEDSLEIFKEFGDETEQAHALIILGPGAHYEHDDQRGRRLVEQAVTICKQAGDKRQLAWSTSVLGVIIRWLGNIDEALPVAKEGLRLANELGEKTITTFAIISLAGLAYDRGNVDLSVHLLGFALTWSKSFGYQPSALQWDIVGREVDAMRSTFGEEAFAQAWDAGASLPFEQAIQFAMQI